MFTEALKNDHALKEKLRQADRRNEDNTEKVCVYRQSSGKGVKDPPLLSLCSLIDVKERAY